MCLHPKFTSAGRIEDEALVSPYSPLIIRKTELESPKVLDVSLAELSMKPKEIPLVCWRKESRSSKQI